MPKKVVDDRTTFKRLGPIVENVVRRVGSKMKAKRKDVANG